ncbi:MAG: PBP1A family penicillin-binding protein [Lachnospiraceae bacterium]|nr:PBP1A family penicillin-binding protein [Lachnospiraceae bacterium]
MKKIRKKHSLRQLFIAFMIIFLLSIAALSIVIAITIMKAPRLKLEDVQPDGYRTSVLDTDGNVVLTLTGEESNRIYVGLKYIPKNLQNAVVAIEDERFYSHPGIDLKGIIRAAWTGISTGHFSQGASTITQQLLKNNVLTSWTSEQTFLEKVERKIQEQYLALVLETYADKKWILENYLNTINLGGGNWGVETASRYYFDKDVSALTLSECAVLAGITKNPTTYNPLRNPEENAKRRDKTLRNMLSLGFISQESYDEAMNDDVYARIAEAHQNRTGAEIFSYFEDALIYSVLTDLQEKLGLDEDEAWNLIYRGGLTIESTEDSRIQSICEEEMNNEGNFNTDAQASIVVIDTESGAVRAMVGGRGEKTASLIYNRAISSVRQPGSTIKILGEYAAGIESGTITLGTVIDDAPYSYSNGTEIHNSNGLYGGMTTVRNAIAQSDNIVAYKCFEELGTEEVFSSIQNFGISTLTDEDKVEALALGGTANGVTNLEMTAAYSSLGRSGEYMNPFYYTKIYDHEGNLLIDNVPESRRTVKKETAALLTSALESVITEGTGIDADFNGVAIAGKSGTTTGARDAWFIGYSPYLSCGVWGGYDDNQNQSDTGYVKRLWKNVMSRSHEPYSYAAFSGTEDLVAVKICTKCGKLAVDGLCDKTVQGDVTATEYFVRGTQPKTSCDCHVSVDICTSNWERAGRYCPDSSVVTRVYLKSATEGTADEEYVIPESLTRGSCSAHTHFWNSWFSSGSSSSSKKDEDEKEDSSAHSGQGSGSQSSGGSSSGEDHEGSSSSSGSQSGSGSSFRDWWTGLFGGSEESSESEAAEDYTGGSGSSQGYASGYGSSENDTAGYGNSEGYTAGSGSSQGYAAGSGNSGDYTAGSSSSGGYAAGYGNSGDYTAGSGSYWYGDGADESEDTDSENENESGDQDYWIGWWQ